MKHNLPNSYKKLSHIDKFVFQHFRYMRCVLAVLCCIMIIPCITYAQAVQSEAGTLEIEEEQYILKRTGDILVKIFGNVELERDSSTRVLLTHVTPEGDSLTHHVMTNDQGYYEFYFSHNWKSIRGNYDVFTSINAIPIGKVSYELIQDPSYKTDQEVKEEYYLEEENRKINAADLTKKIPEWVKNIFGWYYLDRISEDEVINAIQYLIRVDIIKID